MRFASYAERFADKHVPRELDFPLEEYEKRLGGLRREMEERGLDILLIGSLPSICYLTGHQTPSAGSFACLLVPASGEPVLHTIDHEYACARYTSWLDRIETFPWFDPERGLAQNRDLLAECLAGQRQARVGHDGTYPVPLPKLQSWAEESGTNVEWVDASMIVPRLRRTKCPLELEAMRESGRIARVAVEEAIQRARPGLRDSDVAAVLLRRMIEEGSEFPSMGPFVATGLGSSLIHTTWKRRPILAGDLVFIEAGAPYKRYNAPLMRTVSMGPPDRTAERLAAAVADVRDCLLSSIRAGRTGHDLSREAATGFASVAGEIFFQGAFGYPVGLALPPDWAEGSEPFIAEGMEEPLVAGMTLHLPIAARILGHGGVAASETVLVTEDGCEVLTGGDPSLRIASS